MDKGLIRCFCIAEILIIIIFRGAFIRNDIIAGFIFSGYDKVVEIPVDKSDTYIFTGYVVKDTDKAFGSYQNAYVLQGKVYDLLERYDGELRLSRPMAFWTKMNSLKGWILSTLALAVIPSVLWETPWSEIGDFLIDIFHRGMHGLGVFLMSL